MLWGSPPTNSESSRNEQKEKFSCDIVAARPQLMPEGTLELG